VQQNQACKMTSKKKGIRRNKAAKIKAIIEATRRLVGTKGYVATTTNHIARAAGVSIGLVYKYFPGGKWEITYHISLSDHSSIMEKVYAAGAQKGELHERLRRMFMTWISQHRCNEPFLRAMNIVMLENPKRFPGYNDVVREMAQKGQSAFWPRQIGDTNQLRVQANMLALFHTLESIVHRHVLSVKLFEIDQELADFLSVITLAVIKQCSEGEDK
jgi:AcrR family transcriptional regulator